MSSLYPRVVLEKKLLSTRISIVDLLMVALHLSEMTFLNVPLYIYKIYKTMDIYLWDIPSLVLSSHTHYFKSPFN